MKSLKPFDFDCRAVDFRHSCSHHHEKEPNHPTKLVECISSILEGITKVDFTGRIKSPDNNSQISVDFDSAWINKMCDIPGWKKTDTHDLQELKDIPAIKPDALLVRDNATMAVEIEKSNKKTIWFDIIKILMLIECKATDFGLLLVPENYAHRSGVWDLFHDARYYRWCLSRFAKVDACLLSKIAIIGYRQDVRVPDSGEWKKLDESAIREIKRKAESHFTAEE